MSKVVKNLQEMETELLAAETKTVVVDFYAPWCGPCKMIAPKLEEFHVIYPNVVTLKVNVDEAMELAEKYNVSAMPTFLAIREGNVFETVVGADLVKLEAIYKKYGSVQIKPASAVNSAVNSGGSASVGSASGGSANGGSAKGGSASGGSPVKAAEIIKTIKIVEVMSPSAANSLDTQSNTFDTVDV